MEPWFFQDPPDTAVVTTTQVTRLGAPILFVSHELDEDGGSLWQFHCGTVDFDMRDAQLVRLDTIVKIDPSIADLSDLPVGYCAKRISISEFWQRMRET
jgi:hypothetical protein